MRALIIIVVLLVIAAVLKPRFAKAGVNGWFGKYTPFVHSFLAVAFFAFLVYLGLATLGVIGF